MKHVNGTQAEHGHRHEQNTLITQWNHSKCFLMHQLIEIL
jgi:hypothetical protein